jgi:hypothetical protein
MPIPRSGHCLQIVERRLRHVHIYIEQFGVDLCADGGIGI